MIIFRTNELFERFVPTYARGLNILCTSRLEYSDFLAFLGGAFIRRGAFIRGGVYFKIRDFRGAFIRGGRLFEAGRLFEEIR